VFVALYVRIERLRLAVQPPQKKRRAACQANRGQDSKGNVVQWRRENWHGEAALDTGPFGQSKTRVLMEALRVKQMEIIGSVKKRSRCIVGIYPDGR
jgi:hypothetical protein